MRRRKSQKIVYEILDLLGRHGPMTKTEISDKLGLIYYSVVKHITNLEKAGLVRSKDNVYEITEKGKETRDKLKPIVETIELYEKANEVLKGAGLNEDKE